MKKFQIHTHESAPEASKPLLENSVKNFGMIPNLHGVLAESPETLETYQMLHDKFQQTSFDAEELTVVWQTINIEHNCHYCVPAHTFIADMMKVNPAITEALKNKTPLPTPKLEALRDITLSILHNRGVVAQEELAAFYEVGYGTKQIIEIILGLSQKVMSNYINHLAETPTDEVFKDYV